MGAAIGVGPSGGRTQGRGANGRFSCPVAGWLLVSSDVWSVTSATLAQSHQYFAILFTVRNNEGGSPWSGFVLGRHIEYGLVRGECRHRHEGTAGAHRPL